MSGPYRETGHPSADNGVRPLRRLPIEAILLIASEIFTEERRCIGGWVSTVTTPRLQAPDDEVPILTAFGKTAADAQKALLAHVISSLRRGDLLPWSSDLITSAGLRRLRSVHAVLLQLHWDPAELPSWAGDGSAG